MEFSPHEAGAFRIVNANESRVEDTGVLELRRILTVVRTHCLALAAVPAAAGITQRWP